MGPMAQDFYAAFSVGEDDKHISTIDPDGVALAGVQALYRMLMEKDEQVKALQEQIERLQELVTSLAADMGKLKEESQGRMSLSALTQSK